MFLLAVIFTNIYFELLFVIVFSKTKLNYLYFDNLCGRLTL